nr:ASN_HP1_G0028500.mRNA.1.CDS.1 [Saccharomyces cerevisiae]
MNSFHPHNNHRLIVGEELIPWNLGLNQSMARFSVRMWKRSPAALGRCSLFETDWQIGIKNQRLGV